MTVGFVSPPVDCTFRIESLTILRVRFVPICWNCDGEIWNAQSTNQSDPSIIAADMCPRLRQSPRPPLRARRPPASLRDACTTRPDDPCRKADRSRASGRAGELVGDQFDQRQNCKDARGPLCSHESQARAVEINPSQMRLAHATTAGALRERSSHTVVRSLSSLR